MCVRGRGVATMIPSAAAHSCPPALWQLLAPLSPVGLFTWLLPILDATDSAVLSRQQICEHPSRLPLCHTKTRYYFFALQKRPRCEGVDILQRCSEERYWRSSTPKPFTATKRSPSRVSENLQVCIPAGQKFWEGEARVKRSAVQYLWHFLTKHAA